VELFPTLLSKYDVEPNLMDLGATFDTIYKLVWKLDAEIKSVETAGSNEGTQPAYDQKAAKNSEAKKIADELLVSILANMAAEIEYDPAVAYHLSAGIKEVSQFLTGEVQYARRVADRALPAAKRSDVNDVKRGDRKELVVFLRNLFETFTPLQAAVPSTNKTSDGKLKLPSLKGRASSTSETANPTGRYARVYSVVWSVDDETFPFGSDPLLIVRTLWTGAERVGKKLADLHDPFDKAGGMSMKPGESVQFRVNGKTVTAKLVSQDDDED
jgi:hypothetical protein